MLTGVQLGPVSYLLFISVFGSWHHFLGQIGKWLSEGTDENRFVYILDNTLDNSTPDEDNNFDDNNDDDNNHNRDDNNDDKQWW